MGQAEQDPDLLRSDKLYFGQSLISPMFNRVAGQVEVPTGQVNFRGSLPRSVNDLLQPMLHPDVPVNYGTILVYTRIG